MTRDLGLRLGLPRALRWLDRLPAGVAVSVSMAAGTALGFVCLRSGGEVDPGRAAVFAALAAVAVPLAASARPVVVPVPAEPRESAPSTPDERARAWLRRRASLFAALLAVATMAGVVVLDERRYAAPRSVVSTSPIRAK